MNLSDIQSLLLEQVSEIDDIVAIFEEEIVSLGDSPKTDERVAAANPFSAADWCRDQNLQPNSRECLRDYIRPFPEYEELIRSEFDSADLLVETGTDTGVSCLTK